jgi:mono/diheme cytochrome c family protein
MSRMTWVVVLLGLAATASAQDAATADRGKAVFAEQKCKMCHSVAGVGNPKGALEEAVAKLTADDLKSWLQNPKEMAEKAGAARKPPMKSFASLPPEDIDALVAYLQTLKK